MFAMPKGNDVWTNVVCNAKCCLQCHRLLYTYLHLETIAKQTDFKRISIAFPLGIGCGIGGGSWKKYERLLASFAKDAGALNARVHILGNVDILDTTQIVKTTVSSNDSNASTSAQYACTPATCSNKCAPPDSGGCLPPSEGVVLV
jgi:hypothetical protein